MAILLYLLIVLAAILGACAPAQPTLLPNTSFEASRTATQISTPPEPSPAATKTSAPEPSPTTSFSVTPKPNTLPTSKPLTLRGGSLTYDRDHGQALYFGGVREACGPCNETWVWKESEWMQRDPPDSPSPRISLALAFDAARGQTVLYGGFDGQQALGDTWLWDGESWAVRSSR